LCKRIASVRGYSLISLPADGFCPRAIISLPADGFCPRGQLKKLTSDSSSIYVLMFHRLHYFLFRSRGGRGIQCTMRRKERSREHHQLTQQDDEGLGSGKYPAREPLWRKCCTLPEVTENCCRRRRRLFCALCLYCARHVAADLATAVAVTAAAVGTAVIAAGASVCFARSVCTVVVPRHTAAVAVATVAGGAGRGISRGLPPVPSLPFFPSPSWLLGPSDRAKCALARATQPVP
jgi:hypothetical protein